MLSFRDILKFHVRKIVSFQIALFLFHSQMKDALTLQALLTEK